VSSPDTDANEAVSEQLRRLDRARRIKYGLWVGFLAATVGLTWWGMGYVAANAGLAIGDVIDRFPDFLAFFGNFFPPDFHQFTIYTQDEDIHGLDALWASFRDGGAPLVDSVFSARSSLVKASLVTLLLGFMGTVLGFPLALFFGVLGSERVVPFPLNFLFRGTMSAIRAIPALVWIFLYIPIGPPSQVTAVLAIATDSIGNLGRLFTDELEEVGDGPIEAMRTTGAGKAQVIVFGMLAQVRNSFIAWTLYVFEINVRIAVGLGIIGAGGLGLILDVQRGLFAYTNMMATIIVIFLLIVSVEVISQRTRAYLRSEEEPMTVVQLVFGFPERMARAMFK